MPLPCAELRRNRRCALRSGTVVNITEKPSVRHTAGCGEIHSEDGERHGFTNNGAFFFTSDLASPFLPPLTYCLGFALPVSYYHAEVCVQTKISLIFPWPFPAWLPRICLWSQHNARSCSKCTHSGGSAREVQSAHCDLCGAFVTDEPQNMWKVQ